MQVKEGRNKCEQSFNSLSFPLKKQKSHTQEDPFECSDLGENFTEILTWTQYVVPKIGKNPFISKKCGKDSSYLTSFNIHKQSHTVNKSYECHREKGFIQSSALRQPNNTQNGEKTFECHECGKAFGKSSNLQGGF